MLASPRYVSRQTGLPAKRRFQTKHYITLFYSSIITTAAWADSSYKRKRRRDLDAAIAQVEDALKTSQPHTGKQRTRAIHTSTSRHTTEPALDSVQDDEDFILHAMHRSSPQYPVSSSDATIKRKTGDLLVRLYKDTKIDNVEKLGHSRPIQEPLKNNRQDGLPKPLSNVPATTTNDIKIKLTAEISMLRKNLNFAKASNHLTPESIYYEHRGDRKGQRRYWTPKKIITIELTMARLATRLLHEVYHAKGTDEIQPGKSIKSESLRETISTITSRLERIKTLPPEHDFREFELRIPRYGQTSPDLEELKKVSESINSGFSYIFFRWRCSEISTTEAIESVVHQLLVLPFPPDIITMEILIKQFSAMKEYSLADLVIEEMCESHLRPNESTICAVLRHYIRSRNHQDFFIFCDKIKGLRGGLMLARDDRRLGSGYVKTMQPENHQHLTPLIQKTRKIVRRAPLDRQTFFALISGHCLFGRSAEALSILDDMCATIHKPGPREFNVILQDCVSRSESLSPAGLSLDKERKQPFYRYWDLGLAMWKTIRDYHDRATDLSSQMWHSPSVSAMLRLCTIHEKRHYFNQIYQQALQQGRRMDKVLIHPGTAQMEPPATFILRGTRRKLEYQVDVATSTIVDMFLNFASIMVIWASEPMEKTVQHFRALSAQNPGYPQGYFRSLWPKAQESGFIPELRAPNTTMSPKQVNARAKRRKLRLEEASRCYR